MAGWLACSLAGYLAGWLPDWLWLVGFGLGNQLAGAGGTAARGVSGTLLKMPSKNPLGYLKVSLVKEQKTLSQRDPN